MAFHDTNSNSGALVDPAAMPMLERLRASLERAEVEALRAEVDRHYGWRERRIQELRNRVGRTAYAPDAVRVARSILKSAATDALHRGKIGLERWPPGN